MARPDSAEEVRKELQEEGLQGEGLPGVDSTFPMAFIRRPLVFPKGEQI